MWDYPRPPVCVASAELIQVWLGGVRVALSDTSIRVLETSHPPTYYVPATAFTPGALVPVSGTTTCEFKGKASYFDVLGGAARARRAAWTYPTPRAGFEALRDHVALMPGLMDRCLVGGELVVAQPGDFYGGWVTSRVVGPFKGGPGSWGW